MVEGFYAELFTHVGQWGTHVAPPAHFVKGLRTVDQIDHKEDDSAAGMHRCSPRMSEEFRLHANAGAR